jgi:hypothetical protein
MRQRAKQPRLRVIAPYSFCSPQVEQMSHPKRPRDPKGPLWRLRHNTAPFSQQGRAVAANSTFRWSHFAYAISWRTSSSVMPRVCGSIARSRRHSTSSSAADLRGISPSRFSGFGSAAGCRCAPFSLQRWVAPGLPGPESDQSNRHRFIWSSSDGRAPDPA